LSVAIAFTGGRAGPVSERVQPAKPGEVLGRGVTAMEEGISGPVGRRSRARIRPRPHKSCGLDGSIPEERRFFQIEDHLRSQPLPSFDPVN